MSAVSEKLKSAVDSALERLSAMGSYDFIAFLENRHFNIEMDVEHMSLDGFSFLYSENPRIEYMHHRGKAIIIASDGNENYTAEVPKEIELKLFGILDMAAEGKLEEEEEEMLISLFGAKSFIFN